jgi:replicative DNA helicase
MTNQAAISKLMILNSDILSTSDFRKKELTNKIKEEIEKQAEVVAKKYPNLRMYDNVRELDETMREIKRYEPDIVFDDYIQLIKINGKRSRDRRFEIEDIVNEYKWILKRVNAAGILVSQLSRDIEKRIDNTPTMADFSEGGTIEQGAETCMFVYYPYYFDPADNSPYQNEIIVKKARYGKIGTYTVGFSGSKCKFFINPTEAKEMSE